MRLPLFHLCSWYFELKFHRTPPLSLLNWILLALLFHFQSVAMVYNLDLVCQLLPTAFCSLQTSSTWRYPITHVLDKIIVPMYSRPEHTGRGANSIPPGWRLLITVPWVPLLQQPRTLPLPSHSNHISPPCPQDLSSWVIVRWFAEIKIPYVWSISLISQSNNPTQKGNEVSLAHTGLTAIRGAI